MSVLQTIDLKKYYGTEPNITRALDGVNFSVVKIKSAFRPMITQLSFSAISKITFLCASYTIFSLKIHNRPDTR